jgi:hypothetical protein
VLNRTIRRLAEGPAAPTVDAPRPAQWHLPTITIVALDVGYLLGASSSSLDLAIEAGN